MDIALNPSEAGFNALNTLLEGLEKTGRRSQWGFSNWPLTDITPKTAGTVLFNGKQTFGCKVDVSLLNENKKTIGSGSITLNTGTIKFSSLNRTVMFPNSVNGTVNFPNIKAEDLTPSLIIIITAVNGIQARTLNASGYMKIETGEVFMDNPQGHLGAVESVVFSPDGRQVLSGSYDKTIKLWDVATGREIRTFSGHSHYVESVAFSPDGRQVLSGSLDGKIKLWDAATGRELRTLGHSNVVSVAFSPDGRQVLSGSWDKTIKLWDAATGRELRTFSDHSNYVYSVAFSPDGRQVLSGSWDKTIKLWDAATGQENRTFSGHSEFVVSVAFSPDGRQVLSGSYDSTIKLWDAVTGRLLRTIGTHQLGGK